ncbi:MAG: hypothetical protein WC781_00625 [Candidatus Pacearchaeota archaeon]|jgi:hypothetical protein
MNKIVKNKYLDALFKLMLLSAIIHVAILIIKSIISFNLYPLNFFQILEITYFFPSLASGLTSLVISFITMVVIYLIILRFFTDK